MKAGLLPLYVALYDESSPELRPRLEAFYDEIAALLRARGLDVVTAPFCRLEPEFCDAVKKFEREDVTCILTLHMAYSPSLESEKALTQTALPVIVMDTTQTETFGFDQSAVEIDYNHGIHGVMDLCSVLRRNGKDYAICAGHYQDEAYIDRLLGYVRAAHAARAFRGMTVGRAGGVFKGMGDFQVENERLLRDFGIRVSELTQPVVEEAKIPPFAGAENLDSAQCAPGLKASAQLRAWLQGIGAGAFTVNFMNVGNLFATMPFAEICRCMADGIGYAGEGDTLTAALTGALMQGFSAATFVEIFCPDWRGGRLFLSHMGELNPALAEDVTYYTAPFAYAPVPDPLCCGGRYRAGEAVYVNLAPLKDGYSLFCAPVTMESEQDTFENSVRGWMRPHTDGIAPFLEQLSRTGATHHSALVYGAKVEHLRYFGRLLGFEQA